MSAKKTDAQEPEKEPEPAEKTDTQPKEKGRLVLASGAVVAVPAEGVSVATRHYDPNIGATVPVASRFVID